MNDESGFVTLLVLIGAVILLSLIIKAIQIVANYKYGVVFFFILIAMIAGCDIFGSMIGNLPVDINGDELPDSPIVGVVQPEGKDPERDLAFAGVNNENSEANIKNAQAINWIVAPFLIFILLMSVVGTILLIRG